MVQQEIKGFDRQNELPLSISLLVDTSGSTFKDLAYEKTSAEKFFKSLLGQGNPKDAAALYSFNESVYEVRGFTGGRAAQLSAGICGRCVASSGTSLYDAILLASESLGNRDGRHVLVVVTDGGDTTSKSRYANALEAAHLADAVIYPILVVPITNDAGRNTGGENALTQMARDTGGRVFAPSVAAELDQALHRHPARPSHPICDRVLSAQSAQGRPAFSPSQRPDEAPRFAPSDAHWVL